ncbi:unnamed protein product [Orchesella dallaii]|uniref:CUB domain-containing protein n=1 Tax=Orchesella dallaii TaxID=48710 RepID=A0ABP1RA73_9HEXA
MSVPTLIFTRKSRSRPITVGIKRSENNRKEFRGKSISTNTTATFDKIEVDVEECSSSTGKQDKGHHHRHQECCIREEGEESVQYYEDSCHHHHRRHHHAHNGFDDDREKEHVTFVPLFSSDKSGTTLECVNYNKDFRQQHNCHGEEQLFQEQFHEKGTADRKAIITCSFQQKNKVMSYRSKENSNNGGCRQSETRHMFSRTINNNIEGGSLSRNNLNRNTISPIPIPFNKCNDYIICDINKLSSQLAGFIWKMSLEFSRRSRSGGGWKGSSNVFSVLNLILLLCILLCLSSCHPVNCLEVERGGVGAKGGKLSETDIAGDSDGGQGNSVIKSNGGSSRAHSSTSAFDPFHTSHSDKRMTRNIANNNDDDDDNGRGGGRSVTRNGSVILSIEDEDKSIQFSQSNTAIFNILQKGQSQAGGGRGNDDISAPYQSRNASSAQPSSSSYFSSGGRLNNKRTGSYSSKSHINEQSPFEKMSGDEPARGPFFKNMSSSPNKRGSRSVCRLSEFVCKGGKCISADKFCDGVDDCGDGSPSSDEPRFCTPCNRTYYGEVGSTYHLSLSSETIAAALGLNHPQQVDPSKSGGGGSHGGPAQFVCHLTFFAAGDNFGDLVQLMFDSVNIGQFVSSVIDGCPEGSLQVAEIHRPITGGQWCGSGAGFSVYFSEMTAMTLTLIIGAPSLSYSKSANGSLSHQTRPIDAFPGSSRTGSLLPSVHQSPPAMGPPPPPEFDFKMRYKFIPRMLAAVRYGSHSSPTEIGNLEPGTYCNRILEQCHRRRCKIQSPNYPGLYPRNVSCYFTVRQRDKPQCKRVLIKVSQSRSHKVQLRSLLPGPQLSLASGLVMSANDPTASAAADTFMAWEDCNWSRDRIIIYDGNTPDAPVLLTICGGSHIPPVISSGPEIHIAFHSTPFGNPLGPMPPPPFPAPLRGFELDVDVVLVDSETADYSNTPNCTFYFVSSKSGAEGHRAFKLQQDGGNWITGVTGTVSSPTHTLPPNTTCRYEFKGGSNEAIWIYFVSYRRDYVKDSKRPPEGNCTTRLTIRDGLLGHGQPRALLGSFCDSELPKLCEHKALQNETRLVRACTANESYISAGASLIIEQQFLEGTALRPLHFKFQYEFVNRHPAGTEGDCSRHFHMSKMKSKKGKIRTTDNIFDFGRGGKRNLTCTYTFNMGAHDALKLTILRSSFGDRPCRTHTDLESGRYACNYYPPPSSKGSSAGASIMHNDTLSALANASYPTHHPFAADHPGGNNTGGGAGFHHPHSQLKFPKSELTLEEYIWPGVNISSHKNCICSNSSKSSGYTWTFLGRKVQLTFTVENMRGQDGYENFFVEMEYEVLKGEGCRGDNHFMKTESGLISLASSFSHGPRDKTPTCDHYPWLLEAKENHSLYLRIPGFAMMEALKRPHHIQLKQNLLLHNLTSGSSQPIPAMLQQGQQQPQTLSEHLLPFTANSLVNTTASSSNKPSTLTGSAIFQLDRICPTTKNRIFVYDRDNRLVQKICPSSNHQMSKKNIQVVELYSEEFYQYTSPLYPPPKPRFIIEFVGRELGTYRINWLEVMSARMKTALKAMQTDFIGRASIAGRNLGANYSDTYKKELQKITSSWDETLTAMFEEQNELDHLPGGGVPPGTGVDSVHLVDERPNAPPPVCSSYCPELRACISEKLWCDGEIHCPVTKSDENSCDSFWLTVSQLLSPAVYVPLLAAVVSALCCCFLVMLCVGVKKMILSSRFKRHRHHHHHHHHRPGSVDGRSSVGSSCTSTVDRRLPPRDWTLDPHDPTS